MSLIRRLFLIALKLFIGHPVVIFTILIIVHLIGYLLKPLKCKPKIHGLDKKTNDSMKLYVPILNENMIVPYPCINPGAETIGSTLMRDFMLPKIIYDRELLRTSDGGTLALDWVSNSNLEDKSIPIALFIHGYVGDSQADYIKLILPELRPFFRCVSMNYRGRGGVKLSSPQMFNLTDPSDIGVILDHIKDKFPHSKIFVVAYSLGGAMAIQYLVKNPSQNPPKIDSLVCISSPMSGHEILSKLASDPINEWLSNYMAYHFIAHVNENYEQVKNVPVFKDNPWKLDHAMKSKSIKDILERFDVPMFGFQDLEHLYQSCDVTNKLKSIKVPVLIIHADDDPIAPLDRNMMAEALKNGNIKYVTTKYGGHCGYIERTIFPSFWISRFFNQYAQYVIHQQFNL